MPRRISLASYCRTRNSGPAKYHSTTRSAGGDMMSGDDGNTSIQKREEHLWGCSFGDTLCCIIPQMNMGFVHLSKCPNVQMSHSIESIIS